jgi:hypothetical protein
MDAMTLFDLPRQRRPQPKQRDLEGPIHRAVMSYLRLTLRGAVIHHSPNEVGVKGKDIARAIAKAKHNGMVVGFPDIIIIWRGRIWTFEVKAPGRKPTEEQEQVGVRIIAQGGRWAVVRSVDDAAALVREWSQDAREDVA